MRPDGHGGRDVVIAGGGDSAVDTAMRTSVAGVHAAGDITEYAGKVRLVSVGLGQAATAVNNAATHLDPDQPLFPGHSSDDPTGLRAAA